MPSKILAPAAALLISAFACQMCAAQTDQPAASSHPAAASRSTAPAAGTPAEAQPAEPGTSANPGDEPQPHITIATPAPAPAPWSLQDRIKWLTVVLLVLIAYVGVWLAIATLRKIERQTRYAETTAQAAAESAKAALLFAENQAKANRSWILISTKPNPGVINGFTVVATNRGGSPARVVSLAEAVAIVPDESQLPPDPVFKTEPSPPVAPMLLLPGESANIKNFQRDEVKSVCESAEQVLRVEDWKEKIFLYGKVTYADLVASPGDTHETGWCCWYIHGRQKSGMIMAGPLDYNKHT